MQGLWLKLKVMFEGEARSGMTQELYRYLGQESS